MQEIDLGTGIIIVVGCCMDAGKSGTIGTAVSNYLAMVGFPLYDIMYADKIYTIWIM